MIEYKKAEWQAQVKRLVEDAGFDGQTWADIAEATGKHHGSVSGALSVLHKNGDIARLSARRNRRKIYVGLSSVYARDTDAQGVERVCPHCGGDL